MKVFQNGQVYDQVEGWDRGLQFGDGVFETLRVSDSRLVALEYHTARLQQALITLGFITDLSADAIIDQCFRALVADDSVAPDDGVLKVIVTRGNSARGYRPVENMRVNITGFFSEYSHYPAAYYEAGVTVGLCETQAAIQSQLSGLKHLNRLDCVLAAREVAEKNGAWQEGLMVNDMNYVIEGTMSNAFFCIDEKWVTPKLNRSGVAGTMRKRILERASLDVEIRDVAVAELSSVTQMFMCNSLIGLWPVAVLNQRALSVSDELKNCVAQWQAGTL